MQKSMCCGRKVYSLIHFSLADLKRNIGYLFKVQHEPKYVQERIFVLGFTNVIIFARPFSLF